jgi:hypothetical protein
MIRIETMIKGAPAPWGNKNAAKTNPDNVRDCFTEEPAYGSSNTYALRIAAPTTSHFGTLPEKTVKARRQELIRDATSGFRTLPEETLGRDDKEYVYAERKKAANPTGKTKADAKPATGRIEGCIQYSVDRVRSTLP